MSLSTATHRFQRGQAPRDGACLFWSFLMAAARYFKEIFGIFPLDRQIWLALIDHLRVTVTDYILGHSEMHCEVLASQTEFKNVKDYCAAIVSGKLWGGDPELKVLSILYNIIICVIDPTIINLYNHLVPSFYGQDNPLAKRCIYIYFNGKDHFDPLILKNKNTNSFCGIFRRYDLKVTCILWEYIKQLKRAIICQKKNETRDIEKKGALSSSIASTKRKTTEIDNVILPPNDAQLPPTSIKSDYYIPNKRVKSNVESHDENTEQFKYNSRATSTMNILIQAGEQAAVSDDSTCDFKGVDEIDSDNDAMKSDS